MIGAELLEHVHPDLVRVVERAAAEGAKFAVVQGLRSAEAERQLCASGASETMHSRHLANAQGFACAVDLAALDAAGEITWARGVEAQVYGSLAARVKAAALELGIPVEWGGDWREFKDWDHFQLP